MKRSGFILLLFQLLLASFSVAGPLAEPHSESPVKSSTWQYYLRLHKIVAAFQPFASSISVNTSEFSGDIIMSLNNDVRRVRFLRNLPPFPATTDSSSFVYPDVIILKGATGFLLSASYHFSSTVFHGFIFRLKPF